MSREAARSDLPFWLGHMRALLADSELPEHIRQRARYQLVVATLRGTGSLRPVDQVARAYLDESLQESEPVCLEDAGNLLMYAHNASLIGVTTICAVELDHWAAEFARRIEELIPDETPHRRASLLLALGFLGLHPALSDDELPDEPLYGDVDPIPPPWSMPLDATFPSDYPYRNVSRALSAWTELVEGLDETPLFPLQPLSHVLQMLLPLWSTQAEWRRLLDMVDDEVRAREGKNAVAERARDRAMALMNGGCPLEALEELHRARVDWWSGETVRGSVLASLMIAHLYRRLRLFAVAKAYALAAAEVAATGDDEELADLASRGLLITANCEFLSGAWCSAVELYELGFAAQLHMGSGGINFDEDEMILDAVVHLSHIAACAREVDPVIESAMQAVVDRGGLQDVVDDVIAHGPDGGQWAWDSFGEGELSNPPFSDLGPIRCIRFAALGTNWTLLTSNDKKSVRVAERFAAGVQAMLAALAREDLCLIPTDIIVRIEQRQEATSASPAIIQALPSNDGREWRVRLTPTSASDDLPPEEINAELLRALGTILCDASLLPSDDLLAIMDRAFQRGLGNRLSPAIQLDRFVATFANDAGEAFDRRSIEVPWERSAPTFTTHEELRWQDGPGPTYSSDKAIELLQSRYETLTQSLRITVPALSRSEEFQLLVQSLRTQGWLDWHILIAVANIAMNYRYLPDKSTPPSEQTIREMMEAAFSPERVTALPVPVALFTPERMQNARHRAMLSLLNNWDLECHQRTPDIAAIERLLAARYGYWDEDVPHDDPFAGDGIATTEGVWTPSN